jgi:hypothetical protein
MTPEYRSSVRVLLALIVLLAVVLRDAPLLDAQQTTGPHWPVHTLDLGQDQQSIVLRLQFDGPQTVTLQSARVVTGRAFGRKAEPPLLHLVLRDASGVILDQFNAWHPLWAFRFDGPTERRVLRSSASGQFVMPFSPNLARIEVSDVRLAQELIAIELADLAVNSIVPIGVPTDVIVGQQFNVTLQSTVTNHGPATPMDLRLTTTATPSAGIQVVPLVDTEDALALEQGELRTLTQTFTMTCNQPGAHAVSFAAVATPLSASNADLNPANNQAVTQVTVDCVVPVAINIRPGGFPNSANPNDRSVTVAVLTTDAGEYGLPLAFNATTILPLTVRFGPEDVVFSGAGGGSEIHQIGHIEDAPEKSDERTRDGDLDMVLHFSASESGLFLGQVKACVKGRYVDPATNAQFKFFGCDSISVVPQGG